MGTHKHFSCGYKRSLLFVVYKSTQRTNKSQIVFVNLTISGSKIKVFTLNIGFNTPIKLEGKPLEFASDFKYLGSFIQSSGHDFKVRKGKAWGAFWTL